MPGVRSWHVGRVRITQVVELPATPTSARYFFDDASRHWVAQHGWLKPHFVDVDHRLLVSIHCFVIESAGRVIVVDTCIGNDKQRSNPNWHRLDGSFLHDLAAAGFDPARVDTVLCTHLHVDHVGWNTRWDGTRWVPTFPNARYLFARREWAHWSSAPAQTGDDALLEDSVQPIVDAGLASLVEMDHRITDEVWLAPTPGHTPGHVSVRIRSGTHEAVITGDVLHHPIQCAEPDRIDRFDSDPEQARLTRRHFLDCCARERTLVLGTHFAPPTAGHVVAHGTAWRFDVHGEGGDEAA